MNSKQLERIKNFSLEDYKKLFKMVSTLGYKFRTALEGVFEEKVDSKDVAEFKRVLEDEILPKLGVNHKREGFHSIFEE